MRLLRSLEASSLCDRHWLGEKDPMGQIAELVFEAIDITRVQSLVGFVIGESQGRVEAEVDGAPTTTWARSLPPTIPASFASLSIRLEELRLDHDIGVPNAGVRSFRYDSRFDLEISFDLDDVQNVDQFVDALFDFARRAATAHGVEMYFAGLEPASDEETRLFTQASRGPLHLGTRIS